MKYKITESQYKKFSTLFEGRNARHNGQGAETPLYTDQLNATSRKEQQITNNINQTRKEIEKAKAVVDKYNINVNPLHPSNGSVFKIVIDGNGRIRNDLAGRGSTTTDFKSNDSYFGAKELGGKLHLFVKAPKGTDHSRDLPDPKVTRTNLSSPYAEAYSKALAYYEGDINAFLDKVSSSDDYERGAKELAGDRNDAKAQAKIDKRNAELANPKRKSGALGSKKVKGDIRHLLKTVDLTGGPEFSGTALNKVKRNLSILTTMSNYHLSQDELEANDMVGHRKIREAKLKLLHSIKVLQKKLSKEGVNLPIGLAGVKNWLTSDLDKS